MKILIDVRTLGSKPSGIGIYAYNFIKALENYDDLKIELVSDVVESEPLKELCFSDDLEVFCYGKRICKTYAVIRYFKFVQSVIKKTKPDVFWEVNNLIPIKLLNPYGKIAVTIHDLFPIHMPECYGKIYPIYFKHGVKNTLKYVDRIFYDALTVKNDVEKIFPEACNIRSYVTYIIAEIQKRVPVMDKNYFLYLGNLESRKGTDLLLKSYKEYRKLGGNKRLLLAGKMRETQIEQLYETISTEVEGIEYKGYVDDADKHLLLAECSAFLFPTRAEGFGIPILEALSYEKKVISTKLDVIVELFGDVVNMIEIQNGEEAYINQFAEEMLKDEMPENTSQIVEKYSSAKIGPYLYKILKEEFDEVG